MKKDNPIIADRDDSNRKKRDLAEPHNPEKSLLSSKIAKSGLRQKRAGKNQHKGLIIIGLLILVFFGLLIVLIFKLPDSPELPEDDSLQPIESANVETVLEFSSHDANRYYPFGHLLIYLSQDQITMKNYAGKDIYQEQIDFARPVGVYNANYFVAGDRNSGQIIVLDNHSKKFSLHLDGCFAGAYFGGDDYLAIIEENPDQPGFVHIINMQTGEKMLMIQFFESGYPLAVSFSDNLDFFDVLLTNIKGSMIQPIIKRYDLNGNQIGQKLPDDHPFLYGKIDHDSNNNIVITCTSNILVLNFEQEKPIAGYTPGKVYEIAAGKKLTALASTHIEGSLQIVEWDPEKQVFNEKELEIGTSIDNFTYSADYITFNDGNKVKVFDRKSGILILDQVVPSDIVRIGINSNQIILITDQGVKILNL
ncbi:MAG TPA: hypothetical protein GXZ76_02180 [Clostridiaceae bacterium]|nr:hypothetical protein [Clostridiaceae bacterium]